MRWSIFLFPYLLVPLLFAWLVRLRMLERYRFLTYFLTAGVLFYWPIIWEDLRTTTPAPEPPVDNLFPTLSAVIFIPPAMFVQWLSWQWKGGSGRSEGE